MSNTRDALINLLPEDSTVYVIAKRGSTKHDGKVFALYAMHNNRPVEISGLVAKFTGLGKTKSHRIVMPHSDETTAKCADRLIATLSGELHGETGLLRKRWL